MSQKNKSTFLNYKLQSKTEGQAQFISALGRSIVTFCDGPAGTGKTHIPTCYAVDLFRQSTEDAAPDDYDIQRIVLTRPVVDAGRSLGYLPGTMEEKIHPYLMPIYDELAHCLDDNFLGQLLREKKIEICPLSMMRGRNFHRTFVICDEAQNATYKELRLLLTRLGRHSRICISGDPTQSDLPQQDQGALLEIAGRLEVLDPIHHVRLTSKDIYRHKLIADMERLLSDEPPQS